MLIVIADDDHGIRVAVAMLLEDAGHEVTVTRDGVAALEAILRVQPQVAVLDLDMPGMNGLDVARQTRAALGDTVRLVTLTGRSAAGTVAQCEAAGFDKVCLKPVRPRQLLDALEAVP